MSETRTMDDIVGVEFLAMRAKILELAASLDRIQRGSGSLDQANRLKLIHDGIQMLAGDQPNKAERIQLLFSRGYSTDWRTELQI